MFKIFNKNLLVVVVVVVEVVVVVAVVVMNSSGGSCSSVCVSCGSSSDRHFTIGGSMGAA